MEAENLVGDFSFKATGIFDINKDDTARFYTVLARMKGKGNKWVYVGDEGGSDIIRCNTLEEAKTKAKQLGIDATKRKCEEQEKNNQNIRDPGSERDGTVSIPISHYNYLESTIAELKKEKATFKVRLSIANTMGCTAKKIRDLEQREKGVYDLRASTGFWDLSTCKLRTYVRTYEKYLNDEAKALMDTKPDV
jgi:hypothetical protein